MDEKPAKKARGRVPQDMSSAKKEDIRAALSHAVSVAKFTKVNSVEEMAIRSEEYFQKCVEDGALPMWEGYCLALGYDRKVVWDWMTGNHVCSFGADAGNIARKAKQVIAYFEATLAAQGKINPVVYIFRAKNYDGLKDTQDVVVSPRNPLGDSMSAEEIAKALPPSD